MSAIAFLEKMLAAGMPLDMAITAARAFEDEVRLTAEQLLEDRRRKDRERKRAKASTDSAEQTETAEPAERPKADPTHSSEENIPPSPPKGGSSPKGDVLAVRRNRGSRRAPEGWTPSSATLSALEADGYGPGELERALAMVRDHEFRSPRTDWDATFRNWVRRDPPRRSHDRPRPPDQQSAGLAKLEAVGAAMAAAVERYRGVA